MNSIELKDVLNSAEVAYDAKEFERAEYLCKEKLKKLDQDHVCSLFSKLLILLARLQSRTSGDGFLDDALQQLESHLNDDRPCILLHQLTDHVAPFQGTIRSFESLVPVDLDPRTADQLTFAGLTLPGLLVLLCQICLDNDLSSPALNLALQLHLLAQYQDQHATRPSDCYALMHSSQFTLFSDHLSSDQSPVGLSPELWSRLCRQLCPPSPELMNGDKAKKEEEKIVNGITSSDSAIRYAKISCDSFPSTGTLAHQACTSGDDCYDLADGSSIDGGPCSSHDDYLTGMYEIVKRDWPHQTTNHDLTVYFVPNRTEVRQNGVSSSSSSADENELEQAPQTGDSPHASLDHSPEPLVACHMRTSSILRGIGKSFTLSSDGELPKSVRKRVRFSLGSSHPPPSLEDEYGGRSNRRRLLDFARRRQLLDRDSDDSAPILRDGVLTALLQLLYSPLPLLLRCLKGSLPLLYIPFRVLLSFRFWLLFILFALSIVLPIICVCVLPDSPDRHFPQLFPFSISQLSVLKRVCHRYTEWFSQLMGWTTS